MTRSGRSLTSFRLYRAAIAAAIEVAQHHGLDKTCLARELGARDCDAPNEVYVGRKQAHVSHVVAGQAEARKCWQMALDASAVCTVGESHLKRALNEETCENIPSSRRVSAALFTRLDSCYKDKGSKAYTLGLVCT